MLFGRSIGKSGTGVHGVIVLKLKKISPREGDFTIILLRGGIADDLIRYLLFLFSDFSAIPFLLNRRYTVPLLPMFNIFCISLTGVPDS